MMFTKSLFCLPIFDRNNIFLFQQVIFSQRYDLWYYSQSSYKAYPSPYKWLDESFSLIVLEFTATLLPCDIRHLPYLISFNGRKWSLSRKILFIHIRLTYSNRMKKDLLYNFFSTLSYNNSPNNHIRGDKLQKLSLNGKDFFIGTYADAYKRLGGIYPVDLKLINRSIFTLCPAGYGPWAFRLKLALLLGSISVIIANDYVLPFENDIPWEKLVIRLSEYKIDNINIIM